MNLGKPYQEFGLIRQVLETTFNLAADQEEKQTGIEKLVGGHFENSGQKCEFKMSHGLVMQRGDRQKPQKRRSVKVGSVSDEMERRKMSEFRGELSFLQLQESLHIDHLNFSLGSHSL